MLDLYDITICSIDKESNENIQVTSNEISIDAIVTLMYDEDG